MDLVKSVSKYLNGTPRPSLLTRWLTRSTRHSNSSGPTPSIDFIPFWDKEETTGTMRLRELVCEKHKLQAYLSVYHPGSYVFICVGCSTRFYVEKETFRKEWTREDPVLDQPGVLGWQTSPEQRYDFGGLEPFIPDDRDWSPYPRGLGILGVHNGDPAST